MIETDITSLEPVRDTALTGTAPKILGDVTSFILRAVLIFCSSASVVVLVTLYQDHSRTERTLAWAMFALWHFSMGLLIVFMKVKPRQLEMLATIINVPVLMLLMEYHQILGLAQFAICAYLDLWLVFLLVRWPPTYKFLAFLNDEIHYYLID